MVLFHSQLSLVNVLMCKSKESIFFFPAIYVAFKNALETTFELLLMEKNKFCPPWFHYISRV